MPSYSKSPKKQRADQLLVDRGMARSKAHAKSLILAGAVRLSNKQIQTAGEQIRFDAIISLAQSDPFVSRAGSKLDGVLASLEIEINGDVALDVGASTGGFTDCLLKRGARRVYAVDVGRGQLAEPLRVDPRVVSMERINAREPFHLPEQVPLIVADVSFISLRLVLPECLSHLQIGGHALVLVKPQFEAGRNLVSKGGIIKDPKVHASVVGEFCLWAITSGLRVKAIRASWPTGTQGNREFFVLLSKQ